jgi:hypothetical protein
MKENEIEETGQRPASGNRQNGEPREGGERPRRAMNITGEITGKGASQAPAAVLPPSSMENGTSRNGRPQGTGPNRERNQSRPGNKGQAGHRLRAKKAQTDPLRLGEGRRRGRSFCTAPN